MWREVPGSVPGPLAKQQLFVTKEELRELNKLTPLHLLFDEPFDISASYVDNGDRTQATLLKGAGDAGHSYPKVVQGINTSSFGVYNCDQIYRIGQPTNIQPSYVDQNGKQINQEKVACLIDKKYNGSFSFSPGSATLNKESDNVLLLFTSDKRMYMINVEDMKAALSGSIYPELKMTEITDQVKNTEDLKKLIEIEAFPFLAIYKVS